MIASALPQVSLWIEKPTKLAFLIYDLPMISYRKKVYERFGQIIATTLHNITIRTNVYISIERRENPGIFNKAKPFTEEEIATVIAAMLCAFNISVSLPGANCEIVRPFVGDNSAEDKRRSAEKHKRIYDLIQQKVDDLWYVA